MSNPVPGNMPTPAVISTTTISRIDLSASNAIKVVTTSLNRGSNNWSEWSVNFKDYLLSKHAWPYILGTVARPLEAVDPLGVVLWDANNEAIVAIMHSHCSLEEKLFLEGYSNASHAWTTLCERHEQIGPITQVTLICQLLQLCYRKSECFSMRSVNITESVWRIYSMLWTCLLPTPLPLL